MTEILRALKAARATAFPAVRSLLEGPPYHLRVVEKRDLYGLRYQRRESDFRSQVVRQARGIVLEKGSNRIVSWAFDKFYEYGEDAPSYGSRPNLRRSVPDPSMRYERKYDGVLIKVVKLAGGDLLVSTNGKIDAADAPFMDREATFGHSVPDGDLGGPEGETATVQQHSLRDIFQAVGGLHLPYQEGLCYAFELLHPDVPTVVPAQQPALVHLMTRRMGGDHDELPAEERWHMHAVTPPEVLNFSSFGACRDAAFVLPWDDEGFVISDAAGQRIKVKSEAYKAMQRLLVGDSPCEDEDALAVALTLDGATAPLPAAVEERVTAWRARLERVVETSLRRAQAASALAERTGRSVRAKQAVVERALGGRLSRNVRSVLALACADCSDRPCSTSQRVAVFHSLRRSRLGLGDLLAALRVA